MRDLFELHQHNNCLISQFVLQSTPIIDGFDEIIMVGVAIGVLGVIITVIVLLGYCVFCKKDKKKKETKNNQHQLHVQR